jgi:type IV pilus assembly protein PilB
MAQDIRDVVNRYDRRQEEAQTAAYAEEKGLGYINLVNYPFVADVLSIIPEATARQYGIVAFMKLGTILRVAAPDPFKGELAEIMNDLGQKTGMTFEPFICSQTSLEYALGRYQILVTQRKDNSRLNKESREAFERQITTLKDLKKRIEQVSTSQLFEAIIAGGLALEASDIHFEPMTESTHVRFRIDGKLVSVIDLPEKSYKLLDSRIKSTAKIKLDKHNVAQDGRMTVVVGDEPLDIRVNVLPSAYGETIELRLLNYKGILTIEQLGFSPDTIKAIQETVAKPEGMLVFTGPTGSGKTTSLYAVLQLLNVPDRKIITIEDPIEYRIDGIEQVQLDTTAGFDFPQALRAVLRQDPNVIMVGEIRDKETAEIAVNAALTGHLVLSTLHTNSASAAFARLLQMGVPKYLLADAVSLVIAQRLVRRLCDSCRGVGCDICNQTGFKGRFLIAEHYKPDSKTVELIKQEATVGEFEDYFTKTGNKTLLQDGLERVNQGLTTEAEVRSVTG